MRRSSWLSLAVPGLPALLLGTPPHVSIISHHGYKSQSKIDKNADLAAYDSKRTRDDRKARYI